MNGLVREVLSIIAIIVAGTLAYLFNGQILPLLPSKISETEGVSFIGPIAVFLAIILIFRILSGFFTRSLHELALSTANRILGAMFGMAKATLLMYLILLIVELLLQFLDRNTPSSLSNSTAYSIYVVVNQTVRELSNPS